MMNIGFRAEQIFEKTPIKISSNVKNFILNKTCTIAIAKTTFVSCLMPNIFHVNNMQHAYNQICEKNQFAFLYCKNAPFKIYSAIAC